MYFVKNVDDMLDELWAREQDLAARASDASLKTMHETLARCALSARNGGGARRQLSLFARVRVPPPDKKATK